VKIHEIHVVKQDRYKREMGLPMNMHVDYKGKYFTEFETKVACEAIIQTTNHRIQGVIHFQQDRRLIDELNKPRMFLPVTKARVLDADVEFTTEFMALHKDQILWIIPTDELVRDGTYGG
jgi:hypothetical protein